MAHRAISDSCLEWSLSGRSEHCSALAPLLTPASSRIEEVARYCESDVLNTYRVWLVYELFRGSITAEQLACARNKCGISSPLVAQIILTSAQQSVSKRWMRMI